MGSSDGAEVDSLTFEEAVTRLETIVAAMETGSLPLEESLRQFEEAVGLSRKCAEKLAAAERTILTLTGPEGPVAAENLGWE